VRFLRRNTATESSAAADESDIGDDGASVVRGRTPGKGRPTPKRREVENRRRGPVPPPPRTTREAMRRARGNKEERKELAAKRREIRASQRERMMAGEERYLPARDRGPVKAYVRDLVDSRRSLLGLFMPMAVVVFAALLAPNRLLQSYATLFCLVVLVAMVLEGVLNGRRYTRKARAKYPKESFTGMSVGWYAFIRASQIRRLRIPKPRLRPGDTVD
jgi:Protein of unknown function (DUF3043)